MLASERMNRKEVREEYERKICEKLRETRMTVEEEESVSEVIMLFKGAVTTLEAGVREREVQCGTDVIKKIIKRKRKENKNMECERKNKSEKEN